MQQRPRRRSPAVHRLAAPLRLVFRRDTPPVAIAVEPHAPPHPEIEFVAYAEDCILSGHVRLDADRLSDLVNAHDRLELVDVLVSDLVGGDAIEVRELAVSRDEILVLHATGPRGRPERRQRTRQHPIVARLGPYEVRGYLHALPGSDPIAGLRRRRPIVALTDAVIEYTSGGTRQSRRVGTALINRDTADWIVEGTDEDDAFAGLELPVLEHGPLVKDFTGDVLGWMTTSQGDEPEPGPGSAELAGPAAGAA